MITQEELENVLKANPYCFSANIHGYSWVLDKLRNFYCTYIKEVPKDAPSPRLLDFGSEFSLLPSLIKKYLFYKVTCCDRDFTNLEHQLRIHGRMSVSPPSLIHWDGVTPFPDPIKFDAITACWAVQHNLEDGAIEQIIDNLKEITNPGGRLYIVASHTEGDSFKQMNREDPQWVLSSKDHILRIVSRFGQMLAGRYFHYEYRQKEGNWLPSGIGANAVCYEVIRAD